MTESVVSGEVVKGETGEKDGTGRGRGNRAAGPRRTKSKSCSGRWGW